MDFRFIPQESPESCAECGCLSSGENTVHAIELEFERGKKFTFALCVLHLGWFSGDLVKFKNVLFDHFAPKSTLRNIIS